MNTFFKTFFTLLLLGFVTSAQAEVTIQSPEDVIQLVQAGNYDVKTMAENTRATTAALNLLKGSLYNPSITSTAAYEDSKAQPLSPFEPASYQTTFWQTYLQSKTPFGVSLETGHTYARYHLGDASPPNPLLPYPITYYQPQTYVEMSLDLAQDFLGYLTTKQIKMAELDVSAAKTQEALIKHKLTATALELYYQIPILKNIRGNTYKMIANFEELEKSLSSKLERSLAEKSDLLGVQATVAQQKGLVKDADRAIAGIEKALGSLLGQTQLTVQSKTNMSVVMNSTRSCENAILNTPFDTSLSQEFSMLGDQKQKAALQSKTYKRQNIPSVQLKGEAATTGVSTTASESYDDQNSLDWPVYSVGLSVNWQPSVKKTKANRELARAARNSADYQLQKRVTDQTLLWENAQKNVKLLRNKHAQLYEAVTLAEQQVTDLDKQYSLGRVSLFELTQQKINLLKLQIEAQSATQERVSNALQTLQYFDQVSCELIR